MLLAKQTVLSQGFADTFHIMMFVALGGAVLDCCCAGAAILELNILRNRQRRKSCTYSNAHIELMLPKSSDSPFAGGSLFLC
ncbi:hypothetical protein ACFTAO_19155 [Paenibacillus rhizoplanae]